MYSLGDENKYLTSSMAQDGDDLIITKGIAVETTAVLARAFPTSVRKALGHRLFRKAWSYLERVSTVNDALTAVSVGVHRDGVTAMHDATEGGFIAAVLEVAAASHLGATLDLSDITVSEETNGICKLFRINPLTTLSEGTLVIACRPNKTARIMRKLKSVGIWSQVVGSLTSKTRSVYAQTKKGRIKVDYPTFDPYWKAYSKGKAKHWK